MLITREPLSQKKLQFRIRMNIKTHEELMQYCQWAGISYRDFFIEQACEYIFKTDDDWKAHKLSKENEKPKEGE